MKEKRTFKEIIGDNKKKIIIGAIAVAAITALVIAVVNAGAESNQLAEDVTKVLNEALGEETAEIAA